ncbi:hypothetical protein F9L16_15080 [Agarivorans sp. B2Z047]|uniref:hypothetical protein n=1 Tax=Agarivorans sp. B2Z047 TaxID=2652721 RepID=UPI00128BE6AB|nr:hypothetical protein [Agarivorans sp. B2Z047]MPW30309.1 hypothetical protein [Agarivorans sp. B2Z047]UQN43061.1 hypothetical protein LQZ07_00885 [Agarivorans sp. B2Z047]
MVKTHKKLWKQSFLYLKVITLLLSLSVFLPLAALACESSIFVCESDSPKSLNLSVCELKGSFYLERFDLQGKKLAENEVSVELVKSSYHRSLVNEHSAAFSINELDVVLSDYRSEELGELEVVLSVTIEQAFESDFYLCEGSSFSRLVD